MTSSSDADSALPGVWPGPRWRGWRGWRGPDSRLLNRAAVGGVGLAIAVMLAVCAAGPSRAVAPSPPLSAGPPWTLRLHPPTMLVTLALWAAAVAGTAGVGAGLAALAGGARPSPRWLAGVALAVTAMFTVLPPAGSTDVLDYATYGEMVVLGHNPYLMAPHALKLTGDPVAKASPAIWAKSRSVYGPLASFEQAAAAALGGRSAVRIAFWLKVWNSLAFAAVVLALDRVFRRDRASRVRAHLWWSLNPLLLWDLVAAGHIDAMAAAVGLLGVLVLRAPREGRPPSAARALAAGALVGAAADLKITFALFGLAIAWAARRSPRAVAAAAAGAFAVLVPSFLWFGPAAVEVLLHRDAGATADNYYRLITRLLGMPKLGDLAPIALALAIAVAIVLLARLPPGPPSLPAVRPALALSLAWLLAWPYQRPWYDAMAVCVLALFPATRVDWPVLARLGAVTAYAMPGMPAMRGLPRPPHDWLAKVTVLERLVAIPLVRLGALAAVVLLAVAGAWWARRGGPPVSARSSVAAVPAPAAHAHADAAPAPERFGADRQAANPPGPG